MTVIEKQHPHADYPEFLRDKEAKPVDVIVDLKPLPFDPQIIAQLQVGEAIHRKADATARSGQNFGPGENDLKSSNARILGMVGEMVKAHANVDDRFNALEERVERLEDRRSH